MTHTTYDTILYGVAEGVATITLNRPERRNAFGAGMGRELADAYRRADGDDDVRAVVLTGTPPAFCAGADLSPDLARLARVVAVAGRLVSGDTGIAHLATALRTPSVVLFGPTSPAEWGPPRDRPWHHVLWAGRTGDPHGTRPDPGLLEIGVGDVLAALDGLPGRPQAAARRSA